MADDVLLNKAAIIERCLQRIAEDYQGHENALETDQTRQDAIVLNLQRACEAAIDMAMHMVRLHKLGLPQQSREAFTLLEQNGFLKESLATRMCAMVGFRNIAVHQYQQLSLPVLRTIIDNHLPEFSAFSKTLIQSAAK